MKRLLIVVTAMAFVAVAASARAALTVNFDDGTENQLTALTGFGTTGDQMAGMTLTAYFGSGGPESVLWVSLGSPAGQATGTGWSLSESGDTWDSYWYLEVNSATHLSRLVIDAGTGDTVFDTSFSSSTAGSSSGRDFEVSNSAGLDIVATYRDVVGLTGDAPVGDLYRTLDIDFTTVPLTNRTISFRADTDSSEFAGDIQPIPEPASLFVWCSLGVLCGLALLRRRKR